MSVRRAVLACIGVMGAVALSACSSSSPPPALSVSQGWGAEGQLHVKTNQVFTYGAISVCIARGSGPVTITKVEPAKSSGIKLDGWGSKPNGFLVHRNQTGDGFKTLHQMGFETGPVVVNTSCTTDTPPARELAIQVHRTDPSTSGWIDGLTASFTTGSSKTIHRSLWTVAYALCGGTTPPIHHFGNDICTPVGVGGK